MSGARDRIGRQIQQVSRQWRRAVDLRLAPLGLSDATWLPLVYLARVGPARQGEMADYLRLDRSSVVRLVDGLVAQGLVTRADDPEDRRARRLVLTDTAGPLVAAAQEAVAEVRARALEAVSDEELALAARVLDSIQARLAVEEMMARP